MYSIYCTHTYTHTDTPVHTYVCGGKYKTSATPVYYMLSRMVEAVLIIMCTTAAVSTAVLLLGTCVPVRNDSDRANFDPTNGEHIYRPVCDYE